MLAGLLRTGGVCWGVGVAYLLGPDIFSGQLNAPKPTRKLPLEVYVVDGTRRGRTAGRRHAVLLTLRVWLGHRRARSEHVESGQNVLVE